MVSDNGEGLFFLNKSDSKALLSVLNDIESNIVGDWWLTGSISYRLGLPNVQFKPGLRDIDINLCPKLGQDPNMLVTKGISKDFYVIEIDRMPLCGYYFRLIHKKSSTHVDLFTANHRPKLKRVKLNHLSVSTESPEEVLYYILRNILRCGYNDWTIRQKTLDNANKLWESVDQEELLFLLDKNRAEYEVYLPGKIKNDDTRTLVTYILGRQAVNRNQDGYIYPSDCPRTINGISIENEKTHRKALGIGSKRADTLKWRVSRIKSLFK